MEIFSFDKPINELSGDEIYNILTPVQKREILDCYIEDLPSSKDFANKMQEIVDKLKSRDKQYSYYTQEQSHMDMDDLLCDLLEELGYQTGIEIFKNSPRWYS